MAKYHISILDEHGAIYNEFLHVGFAYVRKSEAKSTVYKFLRTVRNRMQFVWSIFNHPWYHSNHFCCHF